MRIKLVVLEKDSAYLDRLVNVLNQKYAEKLQVYSFTDKDLAIQTLQKERIDVFLASDLYEIDIESLPKVCSFAYFVDKPDIEMLNGEKAICKFQKVDLIYKQILNIYSESAVHIREERMDGGKSISVAFCSPDGGSGSSTLAAASALYYTRFGKRVLYLNLEKFGSPDVFFSGEGQYSLSDIIYAIKSKKANLSMKLESCVRQDKNGVYFFSGANQVLDRMELTDEEIITLLMELQRTGEYDYIFADMDFSLEDSFIKLLRHFRSVVMTGTGSEISNHKLHRVYKSLLLLDREKNEVLYRMGILYNKFSSKTCKILDGIELRNIGGIPRLENAKDKRLVEQIAQMQVLSNLVE